MTYSKALVQENKYDDYNIRDDDISSGQASEVTGGGGGHRKAAEEHQPTVVHASHHGSHCFHRQAKQRHRKDNFRHSRYPKDD